MRVVLVCGDRHWRNSPKIREALEKELQHGPIEFLVEGGAEGADLLAEAWAKRLGIQTVRCDALWGFYGKKAGPIRNTKQLKLALALAGKELGRMPDGAVGMGEALLVIAFHSDLKNSKGTADMVKKAKKAGCRVQVVE